MKKLVLLVALSLVACASTKKPPTQNWDNKKNNVSFIEMELYDFFMRYRPTKGSLQSVAGDDWKVVFSHESISFRSESGCLVNLSVDEERFHLSEFATPEDGYRLDKGNITFSQSDDEYLRAAIICIKGALVRSKKK